MILDILLIILLIARPTYQLLVWIVVLLILRHTPLLADEIARRLDLDSYHGLTAIVARLALPAWTPAEELMSRATDLEREKAQQAVHVLRPETTGSPDTIAIRANDDQSVRDQFLGIMADQRDERGGWLFSANQIHAAIGGHRATVLTKVRDRRAATLPPQFRQPDSTTAPATHPVSRR